MIMGIGTDIIEINRVRKAVEKETFINKVYTKSERDYCESRKKGNIASYAGRFAAKEAVLKAFGTGLRNGAMQDIEIINDDLGCPQVNLYGFFKELAEKKRVKKIWISISHSKENATAQCVIEV